MMPDPRNEKPSTIEGKPRRTRWALQLLHLQGGWSGFVVTQPFPVPPDRDQYRRLFAMLLDRLSEQHTDSVPEAFLQMDRIDFRKESGLIREHGGALGDYGLGIYPEKPAPTTWTREEFLEKLAPEKLRPLAPDVMKVDGDLADIRTICTLFLGSGAYVELLCQEGENFYNAATALFKPGIQDKILRTFPYHASLLTRFALEKATETQLDDWSCGATLYLRESVEDNGLLVLHRGQVDQLLRDLEAGRTLPETDFFIG